MASNFNIKELHAYLPMHPMADALLLRAKHGVGKSTLVAEFAQDQDLVLYDIRLGQTELGDLLGLPYQDLASGKTLYAEQWWWPNPAKLSKGGIHEGKKGFVILFDEINRGREDVRQAVFQIVLDRQIYGKRFPNPEACPVYVIAALNAESDVYQVSDLDPALLDRFRPVIDLEPTREEFLTWCKGKGGFHPDLLDFLTQDEHATFIDPDLKAIADRPGEVQPSRRSWAKLNQLYLAGAKSNVPLSEEFFRKCAQGYVGLKIATQLYSFLKNKDSIMQAKANEVEALPTKFFEDTADALVLAKNWKDNQIVNFTNKINDFFKDSNWTEKRASKLRDFHLALQARSHELQEKLSSELIKTRPNWAEYLKTGNYKDLKTR